MLAHAVLVANPLDPIGSRTILPIETACPVAELQPSHRCAFIIIRNGEPLLREFWDELVQRGDVFAIIILPQGGGGGGSSPMKIIGMLAVTALAAWAGPAAFGAMGADGVFAAGAIGSSAFGASMVSAVGMIGGSALLNVVLPTPSLPSPQQASAMAAASPTYSLQAQGNSARIGAAIPEHFGKLRCFPDFAAQPYTEYAGNEQYVYSLLCIGEGEYAIDTATIKIEDTPISGFQEIEYQVVNPGGSLTLFPANVQSNDEISGSELLQGQYIGPFVANTAGTTARFVAFDIVFPRGLYYAENDGSLSSVSITVQAEAMPINDAGASTGSWVVLGTETFTFRTTTPQRVSLRYGVSGTRYTCRMTRLDTKQTDTRYGHEVIWAGLRTYLPETRDYGNITMLALRMRASNNLSSAAARKVNLECTRKLPVWNGAAWSANTATSSIAWTMAYMCKRVGLTDARIGLSELLTLSATWSARGDEFNGRFDATMTFWEALGKVALAGRSKVYMQGGIVRTVRDQAQSIAVAMFSMRNISKGSFSIKYLMPTENTADCVETSYFDRDYWTERKVTSALPGSQSLKPAKVSYFGVTNRQQAYRDGMCLAATNVRRRKIITFETEMEGFIPSLLDLITIQHDMPAWGQHGDAIGWDAGYKKMTVSEMLTWGSGTHYVGMTRKDGSQAGPYPVVPGAADNELFFLSTPDYTPYTGNDYERTRIMFGLGEAWRQPALVTAVKPSGLYRVQIEVVNYDPAVYDAELGAMAPPVQYSSLPTMFTVPIIRNLSIRSSNTDAAKALLSWTPAPGAESYHVECASGDSEVSTGMIWTRVAETTANNIAVTALYGAQTVFRVRGVGMVVGDWQTMFYGSVSDYFWFSDSALIWNVDGSTLMWS